MRQPRDEGQFSLDEDARTQSGVSGASTITDEKLSINQVVSCHFIQIEESVQLGGEGRPVGKKPNLHRSVDEDHRPFPRLDDGGSRRLGTSLA